MLINKVLGNNSNANPENIRDYTIDGVSGLMISYMILVHIIIFFPSDSCTYWMRYLNFFMAWFFYKGGMFFRIRSNCEILTGGGGDS